MKTRTRCPALLALLGLIVTGCATMRNTPQQDYVWSCIEACKIEIPPQCQVTKVALDGNISWLCTGTLTNTDNFNRCLQTQYQEQPYAVWLMQHAK